MPRTESAARRPLRVAQIAAASSRSPWFTNICSEVARRGFEVVAIIDSSEGDLSERLTALGIRHYKVPMYFGGSLDRVRLPLYVLSLPYVIARIAWLLRREHIDIAHSHIFVANFVTRMACLLARTRHVAGIAGPRHPEAAVTRMVERLTWRADDLIVSGSEYAARLYRRLGVPDERIACVYYGSPAESFDPSTVDRQAFRRELGISPDAPLVGLVAHFYPPMRGPQAPRAARGVGLKGHDTFLAAARIVARRFPDARFVLVGGGSNELGETYRQSLIESRREDGERSGVVVFETELTYCVTTSRGQPSARMRPASSQTIRSHDAARRWTSCETTTKVTPRARNSSIRAAHLIWNSASPTPRASSMRRMSASTLVATAKARRTTIPAE